jgi:hypothetical protein
MNLFDPYSRAYFFYRLRGGKPLGCRSTKPTKIQKLVAMVKHVATTPEVHPLLRGPAVQS